MVRAAGKVILFVLPIFLINLLLLWNGFLFSTKNEYVLDRNLSAYTPGMLNLRVIGSSRVENGISPAWAEKGFRSRNIRAEVYNCGMDGRSSGWGLKMLQRAYAPCDLLVIELMPDKSLMSGAGMLPKELSFGEWVNQALSFRLNHVCTVQYLSNIISDIRGRLPARYWYTHPDGWTEVKYINKEQRLHRIRENIRSWALKDLQGRRFLSDFDEFVATVRLIQQKTGCKIIFLRMPVDGTTRILNDRMLSISRLSERLKTVLPGAMIIDANQDPRLSAYRTVEESHLDGASARLFSYRLACIISDSSLRE